MIYILNNQEDRLLDFITLDNVISDSHKKSLEDTLETFEAIVIDGDYSEYLEKRNRIIIQDEDETYQEFILNEVEKYRDSEALKVQFFSHASYLELKKASVISPQKFDSMTPSQLSGIALNNTGWQIGLVEATGTRTITFDNYTNPYSFLKRIAREFECELNFRVETDGRKVIGRYVDLLERIGDWKGRLVEFGRDLAEIRRVEKQDIVTALLGVGPEDENGNRIEVLVEDEEALQRWGRLDEHGNLHHLIEVYEIESSRSEMTEEEARQYTRTALDKRINIQVTYDTTVIDLENVPGLEHEKIRFGDTIRVKDTGFNPPLFLEARVFEMERSLKVNSSKDIRLGDYVEFTEEEIDAIFSQLQNEIRRRLDKLAIISIHSSGGSVFKNAEGSTELTAQTFVGGSERDEEGTLYDYQWIKFDKDGELVTGWLEQGKTIEINASDVDEKGTYRILLAYELDVIATNEITISNVFDGEKGESGSTITDIKKEYYISDDDENLTGGQWSEDRPNYEGDKYLFEREKIELENEGPIETSPKLSYGWESLTTADGKNTIITSETEPPTENRKVGDAWFELISDGSIIIHDFNGVEWVKRLLGEQSIIADSITANHIKSLNGLNVNDQFVVDNQGNVTIGGKVDVSRTKNGVYHNVKIIDGEIFGQVGNNYWTTNRGGFYMYKEDGSRKVNELELNSFGIFLGGNQKDGSKAAIYTHPMSASSPYLEDLVLEPESNRVRIHSIVTNRVYARNGQEMLIDHGNNNVTLSANNGGQLLLGYYDNTGKVVSREDFEVQKSLLFPQQHRIETSPAGNFFFYGNRAAGYPFVVRSHSNGGSAYNAFMINDSDGIMVSQPSADRTSTGSVNLRIGASNGYIVRVSSSRKSKLSIQTVSSDPNKILDVRPRDWFDKRNSEDYSEYLSNLCDKKLKECERVRRVPGLVAEEIEAAGLEQFVEYNSETGEIEGVMYDRLWILLIPLVREQRDEINDLKTRIEKIERQLKAK